ncbi:hypothetical protein GCM10027570_10790 [Streptomonospora sediminis]
MDRKRQKVLIHTHGIGKFDFSSLTPEQLPRVNSAARAAQMRIVPGIFLRHEYLDTFTRVLHRYAAERDRYDQLLGFSVEGPLLGRVGGVPPRGIWSPTADEWERIAELGALGLRYVVFAPDGGDLDTRLEGETTYRDVIDLFYTNGVRIALGHFRHDSPELSAARSAAVIDYIQDRYGPSPDLVLSDHLFNDMPRRFRHVWRTPEERAERAAQLAAFLAHDWDSADLNSLLGDVPAVLVRAAARDRMLPFLNFDGDHVDLAVCDRTLDHLGPDRVIGITDDTPLPELAGETLHHRQGSGLWYRDDGIVAAGSGGIPRQEANLAAIGRDHHTFDRLFRINPERALAPLPVAAGAAA